MTPTPSFRDVEQLSAYLDGQLKPDESARLAARLETDPELASVLEELRQTRTLLRRLPPRRAPRNFLLTPKMVGRKPPLPPTYPIFRFATALTTLLLFFTFVANFMALRLPSQAAPAPYGIGGSGGAAEPEMEMQVTVEEGKLTQEMPAGEESAAPADRMESVEPEEPAAPEPPDMAAPTATPLPQPTAAAELTMEPTPLLTAPSFAQAQEKNGVQPPTEAAPGSARVPVPIGWQIGLAALAAASALTLFIMRRNAASKWRPRK